MIVTEIELSLGTQEVGDEHTLVAEWPKESYQRCWGGSETNGKIDVRHLDIWGKATLVHFPARRFDCGRRKVLQEAIYEDLSWKVSVGRARHTSCRKFYLGLVVAAAPAVAGLSGRGRHRKARLV